MAQMDEPNWPAPRFVSHSAPSGFNGGGRTLFPAACGQALVGKTHTNSATPDDARCGTVIVARPKCGVLFVARGTILFDTGVLTNDTTWQHGYAPETKLGKNKKARVRLWS